MGGNTDYNNAVLIDLYHFPEDRLTTCLHLDYIYTAANLIISCILTIPRHNPVNAYTMGGIVHDAGLTPEELTKLL